MAEDCIGHKLGHKEFLSFCAFQQKGCPGCRVIYAVSSSHQAPLKRQIMFAEIVPGTGQAGRVLEADFRASSSRQKRRFSQMVRECLPVALIVSRPRMSERTDCHPSSPG